MSELNQTEVADITVKVFNRIINRVWKIFQTEFQSYTDDEIKTPENKLIVCHMLGSLFLIDATKKAFKTTGIPVTEQGIDELCRILCKSLKVELLPRKH